jgi:spore coat polysaccharide biosynthesis protein SpsF (cytidylyltransferase family)
MTVVVVQSRLGSTRLPQKGLLDLGGQPVIARVLQTMKHVKADAYYLATDFDSCSRLAPVATDCGWECFAGSTDDVLSRFCRIAEKTDADIIVRATGDNPFLFYDAAEASVVRFNELSEKGRVDYFTYSGLPH